MSGLGVFLAFVEVRERQPNTEEATIKIWMTLKTMDHRLRLFGEIRAILSNPAQRSSQVVRRVTMFMFNSGVDPLHIHENVLKSQACTHPLRVTFRVAASGLSKTVIVEIILRKYSMNASS